MSADSNTNNNDREQTIDIGPTSLDSPSLVDGESCECGIPSDSGEKLGGGKPIVVGDRSYYVMESEPYIPVLDYEDYDELLLDEPPAEFSWKNYNGHDWTTPVRDQGLIGTCWDFAALGAFEGDINVARNNSDLDLDLSEQYVMSCLPEAQGSAYWALYYIMNTSADGNNCNGVIPEWCFPYQASYTVPCSAKHAGWEDLLVSITAFGGYGLDNITGIKNLLMEKGPMATSMSYNSDFETFLATHHSSTDYFPYEAPGPYIHFVVLVGWRDDSSIPQGGYWICKNSWGTNYGYEGFFNIEYNSLNIVHNGLVYWVTPGSIVLYVDDNNTQGPWVGSYEHPYQHIQDGINHALNNDTVYVFNGTYNEHVIINKTIKLIGENANTTIINGGGTGDVIQITTNGIKIRGFTIQQSGGTIENAGIKILSNYNTIIGNTISDNLNGILCDAASHNQIDENIITQNLEGIMLENHASCNTIQKNTIQDNIEIGIWIWYASDHTNITENTLSQNQVGMMILDSSFHSITRNTITQNDYGVYLDNVHNTVVYLNNFIQNTHTQAHDHYANNQWNISSPAIGNYWDTYTGSDTNHDGIGDTPFTIPSFYPNQQSYDYYPLMNPYPFTPVVYVDDDFTPSYPGWGYDQFCRIQDGINTVMEHGTVYVSNGTYSENIFINTSLNLVGRNANTTILQPGRSSDVVQIRTDAITITGFTIQESFAFSGIHVTSNHNNIFGNHISHNQKGIFLDGSSTNSISQNIFDSNSYGLYVLAALDPNTISDNIFTEDSYGIYLSSPSPNTIRNNIFFSCGIQLHGDEPAFWNTHIIENNIANNRPIRYYKNIHLPYFEVPENTSQVILVNCSGFLISSLTITEVDYGIQLGFCSNITITENTITYCSEGALCIKNSYGNIIYENLLSNNNEGISLTSSFSNTISSNYISNNSGNGISLYDDSSNNTFSQSIFFNNSIGLSLSYLCNNNNISGNTMSFNRLRGLCLSYSFGNNINRNTISNHSICGLFFANSNSNIIFENEIVNNSQKGIHLIHSSNNYIYHNNFMSNSNNAYTQNSEGNTWDNGYNSAGNYWSDYTTRYPQAHRIDGIWDTPYVIRYSENNQDNYPLVEPWNGPDIETPQFGDDRTPLEATTGEDIIFLVNVTDNIRVTDVWLHWSQSDELNRYIRMARNEMTWSCTFTVNLFDAAPIFYFFEAEDSAGNLAYMYHENHARINISDNDPPVTQCETQWNVMTLVATDNYAGVEYTKYLLARKSDGNYDHVWHDYIGPVALPAWVEMIYFYSVDSVDNVETDQSIFLGLQGEVPYDPFPEDPR